MPKGINAYGIFETSPLDYSHREYEEIQEKIALKKRKKSRAERIGENILGSDKIKSYPWDF